MGAGVNWSRIALASTCVWLSACGLMPPQTYDFRTIKDNADDRSDSIVKDDTDRGDGAIVVWAVDGFDTQTHPEVAKLNATNPDLAKYHILVAPRALRISPGHHQLGVEYDFQDVNGVLVEKHIAVVLQQRYAPNCSGTYVKVQHRAMVSLEARPGHTYLLSHYLDEKLSDVRVSVQDCATSDHCDTLPVEASQDRTQVTCSGSQ